MKSTSVCNHKFTTVEQTTIDSFDLHAPPTPVAIGVHCRIQFMSAAYLKTQLKVHCPALSCTALHFPATVKSGAGKSNEPNNVPRLGRDFPATDKSVARNFLSLTTLSSAPAVYTSNPAKSEGKKMHSIPNANFYTMCIRTFKDSTHLNMCSFKYKFN